MTVPFRGAALILLSLAAAACAGPMSQREAQARASRSLRDFCAEAVCGPPRLVKAQKIKNRWLVDFETAGGFYTVAVDSGGDTNVTVWDKTPSR